MYDFSIFISFIINSIRVGVYDKGFWRGLMKILISPDSFKGSLSAENVAKHIERGIKSVKDDADTLRIPMADGGEGTLETLVTATNGKIEKVLVNDPLGRRINGHFGIIGNEKTAVIELAVASGLPLLTSKELNPAIASTYGTGQLIKDALGKGIRSFIICLGGSATNDGGTGILKALGYRFLDKERNELKSGGLALKDLSIIDDTYVDERVKEAHFQIACDVSNPLIGPNGASHVFGPQKGALPELVNQLDEALRVFADVVYRKTGRRIHNLEGGGAAGLYAFCQTEMRPGVELMIETLNLSTLFHEQQFDLIITGEGKLDEQTAYGKVVSGITKLSKQYKVPIIAIAGTVEGDITPLHELGLTAAFSIINGPMDLETAFAETGKFIEKTTEQLFRLFIRKGKNNIGTDNSYLYVP